MPADSTPPTPPRPRRRIWTDTEVSALTEGVMPDDRIQAALRTTDSRGMNATSFAILRTACRTESLAALLTLLDPPEAQEQTQLDQVVALLESIAAAQIRTEARLVAIESRLAERSVDSPPRPPPARPGSRP